LLTEWLLQDPYQFLLTFPQTTALKDLYHSRRVLSFRQWIRDHTLLQIRAPTQVLESTVKMRPARELRTAIMDGVVHCIKSEEREKKQASRIKSSTQNSNKSYTEQVGYVK